MKIKSQKSQLYLIPGLGHIYAYSAYPKVALAPFCSVLSLSISGQPILTKLDGVEYRTAAHLAGPALTEIDSGDTQMVSFVFYALNPVNLAIRATPLPRVQVFDRDLFRQFDSQLARALNGELSIDEAEVLFADMCRLLLQRLPPPAPIEPRVAMVLNMLMVNPEQTLAELAQAVSLSTGRLTHLFSHIMGINLRRQRLAIKIGRSVALYRPNMNLTEIALAAGFSDSAHMTRACREINGQPPSYYLTQTVIHLRRTPPPTPE